MRKFFKLLFGRLIWITLIILLELSGLYFFSYVFPVVIAGSIALFANISEHIVSVVSYSFSALKLVIDLFVMIYIVNTKSNSSYKIGWLFVIAVLSTFGAFFYFLFGNKTTSKKLLKKMAPYQNSIHAIPSFELSEEEKEDVYGGMQKLTTYLKNVCGIGAYARTQTKYFKLGEEGWKQMLIELEKANKYIFMEYFIIERGKMWNSILEILKRKASEGVDVRVMYDDLGCSSTLPFRYNKYLESLGIKCVVYNRVKPVVSVKFNNRDHRKITVIDGHTGFTGGVNLADEYINEIERFGHWKDNMIMLKGEGVHGLTMLFLTNWTAFKGNPSEITSSIYKWDANLPEGTKYERNGFIQPYGDLPFDNETVCKNLYLHMIQHANKFIHIATPYLIIDDEISSNLCTAAKQGVDVHIIVPHIPDKKMVFGMTRSYYKVLLEAGVHIHEYTPGFIHEKVMICDNKIASIGTCNFDYRSLYLHMECGVFLHHCDAILDMEDDYLKTLEVSEEITLQKYKKMKRGRKLWWAILRVISPLM